MIYLLRRKKLGSTSCKKISEKSLKGIQVLRNDKDDLPKGDLVFRWGCTSSLPPGSKVVNEAKAIHLVSDKRGFREILEKKGGLAPRTFFRVEDVLFPAIVRPSFHHQGRHLYLVNNQGELKEAIRKCVEKAGGWYASEVIKKEEEYRVFVVQGRVVAVARKYPANAEAIAWNVFQGGRFENTKWDAWPLKAIRVSLDAFALSGLDFGGVDVMVKGKEAYVLEINSAPSLTSDYRQGCFAKAFDWIIEKGKTPIPLSPERGGYKKFIHPAISNEAILGA